MVAALGSTRHMHVIGTQRTSECRKETNECVKWPRTQRTSGAGYFTFGSYSPPFPATGHQTYLCALQAVCRQAHTVIWFTVFSFNVGLRPNHLLHATHLVGILAAADLMSHLSVKKKSHT